MSVAYFGPRPGEGGHGGGPDEPRFRFIPRPVLSSVTGKYEWEGLSAKRATTFVKDGASGDFHQVEIGVGVFAKRKLQAGLIFPYSGKRMTGEETASSSSDYVLRVNEDVGVDADPSVDECALGECIGGSLNQATAGWPDDIYTDDKRTMLLKARERYNCILIDFSAADIAALEKVAGKKPVYPNEHGGYVVLLCDVDENRQLFARYNVDAGEALPYTPAPSGEDNIASVERNYYEAKASLFRITNAGAPKETVLVLGVITKYVNLDISQTDCPITLGDGRVESACPSGSYLSIMQAAKPGRAYNVDVSHARISYADGSFFIEHIAERSTSATFVDEVRLESGRKKKLSKHTTVSFGKNEDPGDTDYPLIFTVSLKKV